MRGAFGCGMDACTRILEEGARSLCDVGLVAAGAGCGPAVAAELCVDGLWMLRRARAAELHCVPGIDVDAACRVSAAIELGARVLASEARPLPSARDSGAAAALLW